MQIIVDADACPVVDIISEEAKKENCQVILVKSYSHFTLKDYPSHVSTKYVDEGADSADYTIVQLARKNDIVVTQDYGLAALCLEKDCHVLHHAGFAYSKAKMDQMLQQRHQNAMMRKAGYRTKGPKKLSAEQKNSFRITLQKLLTAN